MKTSFHCVSDRRVAVSAGITHHGTQSLLGPGRFFRNDNFSGSTIQKHISEPRSHLTHEGQKGFQVDFPPNFGEFSCRIQVSCEQTPIHKKHEVLS